MRTRPFLASLLCIAPILAGTLAGAAEPTPGDDALLKTCRAELEQRLFGAAPHGESFIVVQEVKREAARASVRLDLASGEGRRIAGTCIFRDGKLFDVKS